MNEYNEDKIKTAMMKLMQSKKSEIPPYAQNSSGELAYRTIGRPNYLDVEIAIRKSDKTKV